MVTKPPAPEAPTREWGKIWFRVARFVIWIGFIVAGFFMAGTQYGAARDVSKYLLWAIGAVALAMELGLLFFVGSGDPIKKIERQQAKQPQTPPRRT